MLETYVIHLTKQCNMKCTYCYEDDKTSEYTWEEIKKVIDDIVKYNKKFSVEFLGGEPCLRIDLLVEAVHYLESIQGVEVIKYIITTNGTLINQELVNLMKNNSRVVWAASIDGTKFMNFMRVMKNNINSYDTVISNFHILKNELGEGNRQLGCHMVTHLYNIGYYMEGITNLYNQGFRFIDIGTIEYTMDIDQQYCDEFLRQNKILSDRMHDGEFPDLNISIFNNQKPKGDAKHYVTDDNGRVLFETFGRAENDIKDSAEYKTEPSGSKLGDLITRLREAVYNYHNRIQ